MDIMVYTGKEVLISGDIFVIVACENKEGTSQNCLLIG